MIATIALTAKYRPQTFADVAGQATIKTILSRAAAENRVAAAYLFSGTRGVGKTTVARIFAKALNCRKAPAPEPCNECDLCRSVTTGMAVDVIEIDGASNRGIDDVRRLKEVVGYAPMDGRYKVFIIDEAHMLSRDAFNALLKTLEEPPAGVTFIMATTEPHKFPATIISRCQHFIFKALPENELADHLRRVLTSEAITFDERAIRLVARRGAGSVRDSMSLLSQVLALGDASLTEATVRSVLGLAGQEVFLSLLAAVREGNTLALVNLLRSILEQGLDIGFFLRELAGLWRNLFLLRQSGESAFTTVDLPAEEAKLLLEQSAGFSLAHIHACWQMTLEGQRRVQTSLEPGLALELLLLNLAMLPRLMPLDSLSSLARKGGPADPGRQTGQMPPPTPPVPPAPAQAKPETKQAAPEAAPAAPEIRPAAPEAIQPPPKVMVEPAQTTSQTASQPTSQAAPQAAPQATSQTAPLAASQAASQAAPQATSSDDYADADDSEDDPSDSVPPESTAPALPSWNTIVQQAASQNPPSWFMGVAHSVVGRWQDGSLVLCTSGKVASRALLDGEGKLILEKALEALTGKVPPITFAQTDKLAESRDKLREKVYDLPSVQMLEKNLGAKIVDFGAIR